MATLAELWTEEPSTKVTPQVQRSRDAEAIKILQDEYRKMRVAADQGQPRAAGDLEAIGAQLKRMDGEIPATEPQPYRIEATGAATGKGTVTYAGYGKPEAPKSGTLAEMWDATEEKPTEEKKPEVSGVRDVLYQILQGPIKGYEALRGAGEAGAQLVSGGLAAVPAGLAGLARAALPGAPGAGAETTRAIQQALTYQPKTEAGQQISAGIAKAMEVGAMGAPERGEAVLERTGSPALATATEILTNPLNLLPAAPAAMRGVKAAARPITETMARWKAELEPTAPAAPVVQAPVRTMPEAVEAFRQKKGEAPPPGSVGAAGVTKQTEVQSLLNEASPELKQQLANTPAERVNTDALQTRLLEEKYGVSLSTGQRTGNRNAYASEWNNRGAHPDTLAPLFENQPKQMMEAIDNLKGELTPDIRTSSPSELGQTVIDALRKRDEARQLDINQKYQALRDAAGGDFPVDSKQLLNNVEQAFKKDVNWSAGQKLDPFIELKRLAEGNEMTYDAFLAMRRNLGRLQASSDGTTRGLASLMIKELEKLPLRPEVEALQPLADAARKAAKERFDIIKRNPAYKEAIAVDLTPEEIAAGVPARGAEMFIDKHTRQKNSLLRLLDEVGKESPAHQAIRAHELDKLKVSAGFKEGKGDLSPRGITNYMHKTGDRLLDIYGPEGIKNLQELDILSSKIGQPKTGVFNHSNSTAAAIAEMAKRGITTGLEGWAATHTGGASIPITAAGRKFFENKRARKFGEQAIDPYGGIVQ